MVLEAAEVEPLSYSAIDEVARVLRRALEIEERRVDMFRLLDLGMARKGSPVVLCIVEDREMPRHLAVAYPAEDAIIVRESVALAAANGCDEANFTLAHEFGHVVLHRNSPLARATRPHEVGVARLLSSAEFQADAFACSFLVPRTAIEAGGTAASVSQRFGLSVPRLIQHAKYLRHKK